MIQDSRSPCQSWHIFLCTQTKLLLPGLIFPLSSFSESYLIDPLLCVRALFRTSVFCRVGCFLRTHPHTWTHTWWWPHELLPAMESYGMWEAAASIERRPCEYPQDIQRSIPVEMIQEFDLERWLGWMSVESSMWHTPGACEWGGTHTCGCNPCVWVWMWRAEGNLG